MLRWWLKFLNARRIATYPPLCLAVLIVTAIFYARHDPTFFGGDFRAFYTAGTFVRRHQSHLLYDQAASLAFQSTLGHRSPSAISAWLNPPVFAWMFVPLSRLSFTTAFLVHSAVALGLGFLAFAVLDRELTHVSRWRLARAAALYWPVAQWLSVGQTTGIWLLIYSIVFVALRRGAHLVSGLALGCLACKPQLGLGLAVVMMGGRQLRAAATGLTTFLLWAALSWWTLPDASRDYVEKLPAFSSYFRSEGYPTAGLHGLYQQGPLLLDGLSPAAGTLLGILLTAGGVTALFGLWWKARWDPGSRPWDLRMAASIAVAVLVSPHLYGYDRTLFLIPLAIVCHAYPAGTAGRPLDGGPLLAMTALVWSLALLGPALTVAQQWVSKALLGASMAVQLDVVAAVGWVVVVVRESCHGRTIPGGDRDPVASVGESATYLASR